MPKKIAIFIPSLNRPDKLEPLINNIREVTTVPYKCYFIISDDKSADILERLGQTFFRDNGDTYPNRMNFLYKNSIEPYMFMGSDDIWFTPNWDIELMKCTKESSVIVGDDCLNPNGTMALISRKYVKKYSCCIDTPDVLFYPGYKHNYADTEQFMTAKKRGVFTRCMNSKVEHRHYISGKTQIDDTYIQSNNNSEIDKNLFESRKHLWG